MKKWGFGILLAVAAVFILVITLPMILVPLDINHKYLLEPRFNIDDGWELGELQPVYLYSYEKEGTKYIKAAFRDIGARVKLVDIFVGGKAHDLNISLTPFGESGDTGTDDVDTEGYKYPLRLGDRIRVIYIAGYEGVSEETRKKICDQSSRVCDLSDALSWDVKDALLFRETGSTASLKKLYALFIGKEIVKNE